VVETDASVVAPAAVESASTVWLRRHSLAVFVALVLFGSLRIVITYTVFSHTWDEPDHVAAGTEWLTEGTLHLDYSHPPVARVAAAIGPYLANGGSHHSPYAVDNAIALRWGQPYAVGLAILHLGGHYDRNLAMARLGILPFFWIACLTVYLWARRYMGEPAASLAVFFFTFLPPILAHAGLATTDMALTAFLGASFLMTFTWIGKPGLPQSLLLGVITGFAVLSKFSALPFLPVALAAAFIAHFVAKRPASGPASSTASNHVGSQPKYARPLGIAILTCMLVIWAGYRFSFGLMDSPGFIFPVPAPELFAGLRTLVMYNAKGHASFLMGKHSLTGWWYFFLAVLAVKTPLPFLALTLFGAITPARKNKGVWLALSFSLGILLFAMTSHLNLGVRHVLPVYLGFSIVVAAGAERLLARSRWIPGALMFWMAATSLLSHPDYLPYFNAMAGDKHEKILVDSDLDWGQDLKRLARRLKEVGAPSVAFTPYLPVDLKAMGFPSVSPGSATEPAPGWNAVSMSQLKLSEGPDEPTHWQEKISPRERIGKGIWLWYFPPNTTKAK
jgi:hypothetical protein